MILNGKGIEYEWIDISTNGSAKLKMWEICGDKCLPPQFVRGDTHLGVSYTKLFRFMEHSSLLL